MGTTEGRIEKVRQHLRRLKAEAILVSNLTNVRYLTGFSGTAGVALVTAKEAEFHTDFRYETQAREQAKGFQVVISRDSAYRSVSRALRRMRARTVALESHCITVDQKEQLQKAATGITWISGRHLIEKLRVCKDETELARIRHAVDITDRAYCEILGKMKPGMTEREVAFDVEQALMRLGAEGKAFETIVASGPRAAMPHGVASDRKLTKGDLVILDFGAKFEGYNADLTRTLCLGRSTPEQRLIYSIVRTAQQRAVAALRAGEMGRLVDAVAREYIREKGFGKEFGHSLGHGVGLEVHEAPRLAKTNAGKLPQMSVVTIEPGIYIRDWGGVRIEDMAVVCERGREVLTRAPKPARLPEI